MTEQPTRIRWLIIFLTFLIYVLMFIDRVNISIAATYIMPEYGLTEIQIGWTFSAFVLGYALVQIPSGWLGVGLGEAAAPPNGNRVIANWAAPNERGLALGIAVSGSSLGAALTLPLIVVGARPNFMKIALLIKQMRHYPDIVSVLVHTGQHYDATMAGQFFTNCRFLRLILLSESAEARMPTKRLR